MKTLSSILLLVFFFNLLKGQDTAFPALPDSCFDVIVFAIPTSQLSPAKEKFAQELDSLLHVSYPDTFVLATIYRRLSTALLLSSGDTKAVEYALKSLQLFEQLRRPLEIAKSRLAYASSLFLLGQYDTAINLLQTAVEQNRALFGEFSSIQQLTYRVLCVAFHNVARYKESLFYINESVRIARTVYPMIDLRLAKSLWTRGASLYEIKQLEASLKDFLEAKDIVSALLGDNHPAIGEIYQRVGRIYKDMGDLENALGFYQQSLNLKEQNLGSDHEETLYTRSWIAEFYLESGDFNNALYHQEKAWAGYTKNNTKLAGSDKACKMVQLYAIVGNYQKEAQAFQYLTEKCENFGGFGSTTGYTADGYYYHAWALILQNRATEALSWIDKTLKINQLTNPDNHSYNHKALLLKADALTQLQRFDEATVILQSILQHSPLPNAKKQALAKLATIHFKKFKNSSQQVELQQSWSYQLQALQTLDSMRYTYQSAASRIQQAELNFHLFESALNTSYERRDLSSSFWVAEKSKATALLDNQRDDLARRIAGLPDTLLHRESSLKSQIAELEKTVYEKPPGAEKKAAEAALFEKKQSLNTLLQRFEKNYPLYFQLKYNTSLASATQLQANLPPATAMLEYFVGDSSIFVFSITARDLQLWCIAKPKDFEVNIQALRQALTNAELRFLKKDFYTFTLAASKLYDYLLATPLATLPPGIKHLIVVPDGSLNYVPFEVLGKNNTAADFKSYPYLLKNYSISYATSANLWLEQSKTATNRNTTNSALDLFAGFAPSYNSSDTLSSINSRTRSLLVRAEDYEIPGAALEVQEIAKLLNGKTWLGDAATKTQFKQQSPHFRVLHLAMHSIMDDANPLFSKLLFTQLKNTVDDNDLYANDLYNLRLPAQMVVLSACNTGNGQLRRGEGVMSLSRAFTFTGVPSTVMSLWKAPDEATRKLMLAFYQNLKLELPKDEALQKAKLSHLLGAESGLSSPFFWAGFVANGDMRALFGR